MDHKKAKHITDKSGRKGRIDEHTLGYYRRVSETIKDGFKDPSEKGFIQPYFIAQSCCYFGIFVQIIILSQ